jgi:parallel beta-helix repeat protein
MLVTYYVDDATGYDSNTGLVGSPWETIQHAAQATLNPGDIVIVRAGTYTGFYRDGKSGGTSTSPITFSADPSVLVTGYAPNTPAGHGVINIENTTSQPGYYVIEGFEVNGSNPNDGCGIRTALSTGNIIRNNKVHDCQETAIFASRSDGIVIENNECYNSGDEHGIYVSGTNIYTIRGNICRGNRGSTLPGNGIHTNVFAVANQTEFVNSNGLIENNIVYDNAGAGMDFVGMQNSVVRNNVVYANERHSIVFHNQSDLIAIPTCSGNVVVNNTCHETNTNSSFAIQFSDDYRNVHWGASNADSNDANTTVFNNILLSSSLGAIGILGALSSTFKSNNNVVTGLFKLGTAAKSLPAWRASEMNGGTGEDGLSILYTSGAFFVDSTNGTFGARNYHLVVGAPAINVGVASFNSKDAANVDFEGDLRETTPGYDVGYDEYHSSVWASYISNVITVHGSSSAETIRVYQTSSPANTYVKVDTSIVFAGCPTASVTQLVINAGGGNDTVYVETASTPSNLGNVSISTPATINGEAGNDILYCGNGNDVANGGDGTDSLYGCGGGDTLAGGAASDVLWGDVPGDSESGGDDTLTGGDGADSCYGGYANDTIYGDDPADVLANGNDTLYGDDASFPGNVGGADTINCGPGADSGYGGYGIDVLNGDAGNDNLYGDVPGSGYGSNDTINGGADDDYGYGGAGDDTLTGNGGSDHLYGDAGSDRFFVQDTTLDWVDGGAGNDTCSLVDRDNGLDILTSVEFTN